MNTEATARAARVAARKARQDLNLFGRLAAAAIGSRVQAQHLLQSTAGLSITQWRILWDLHEAGPLSVRDLASIQRTDASLISRSLPIMRNKGYIKTAPNAHDKRQSLAALTRRGVQEFEKAAPIMEKRRNSLTNVFSQKEMTMFLRLLDQFETYLEQPVDLDSTPEKTR